MDLLVNYESEEEIEEPKKKKLKLPNPLKSLKSDTEEVQDDPKLHDFRIRSFPHVRGNWASFVYVKPEIDLGSISEKLAKILSKFEAKTIPEPHLSLSKVFTLQYHWIESFNQSLKSKLKQKVTKFPLGLSSKLKIFVNEDSTRTFVTVEINENQALKQALSCVDETLVEFGQEIFYKPAEFHISLVWILKNPKIPNEEIQNCFSEWIETQDKINFTVEKIHAKIGNKFFEFDL